MRAHPTLQKLSGFGENKPKPPWSQADVAVMVAAGLQQQGTDFTHGFNVADAPGLAQHAGFFHRVGRRVELDVAHLSRTFVVRVMM